MSVRLCRAAASTAVALVMALSASGTVQAHDMGTSRAHATLRDDGTFLIEVVVDPRNLLAQLALIEGRTPREIVDPSTSVAELRANLDRVARGIEVYFDGQRAPLTLEYQPSVSAALAAGLPGGPGDAGTVNATGKIPHGARQFAFAYHWTYGAMPLVVQQPAGPAAGTLLWLGPRERSTPVSLSSPSPDGTMAVARQYVRLGFTHILPLGVDHILFVLGLFFLSAGWRALLLQVSTFTVAHTLTLGLTMLGVVSAPAAIVEPLIALSIAYVAIENLTTAELRRSRLVLIFGFGLLHGMGFAGVLSELGVPASRFLPALLSFNIGVELGQLAVLGAATLILAGWRQRERSLLPLVARPASVLIAAGGLFWTIERLVQ